MNTAEYVATLKRIAAEVRFISVRPAWNGSDTAPRAPRYSRRDDSFILNAEDPPVAGLGRLFAKSQQASRAYRQVRQAVIGFFNAFEALLDEARRLLECATSLDGRQQLGLRRMNAHVRSLVPTVRVMRLKRRALLSEYQQLELRFQTEAQTILVEQKGIGRPPVFENLRSGKDRLMMDEDIFEKWAAKMTEQNEEFEVRLKHSFPFYGHCGKSQVRDVQLMSTMGLGCKEPCNSSDCDHQFCDSWDVDQ
ncbi:MAG: hypothetical protein LQ348_003420 [Seirophora lacunosa]|nr:MAG: hypothetical protein LQ348_003420 [Seirophora lacunosa]